MTVELGQIDLAWEYIKLFSSLQVRIDMFETLDYVGSPRLDFYRSPVWLEGQKRRDWMKMVPEIAMTGSVYPFRRSTELTPIWRSQIEEAVAGRKPLFPALEETERLYNQILSRGR